MLRVLTVVVLMTSTAALAQDPGAMSHHSGHAAMADQQPTMAPTQPGQAAFAAIQEIVQLLEADSSTNWSKVNIEALRRHLIDMNNVTHAAEVHSESVEGGIRFIVTGTGPVCDSIRRMVSAHAAAMNGGGEWTYAAADVPDGAALTVRVPVGDLPKLRALGFIGVLTNGVHHPEHHLMIARGEHPHG